jgi:hypothetical protein
MTDTCQWAIPEMVALAVATRDPHLPTIDPADWEKAILTAHGTDPRDLINAIPPHKARRAQ